MTQKRNVFDIFQAHHAKERIRAESSIPAEPFRFFCPVVERHLRVMIFLGGQKFLVPARRSINDGQGGPTVALSQQPYLYVTRYVGHAAFQSFRADLTVYSP